MRVTACAVLVFALDAAASVNVLSLGAKNDGSADVSEIVTRASERDALFFPAGIYRVAKPIWLRHGISGEGYARSPNVDRSRTWFVSDIVCTNGEVGVINFSGNVQVGVEGVAITCRSAECGISVPKCCQSTYTFISRVGVYGGRAAGLRVRGSGSRPIFVQDFTMFGAADWPAHSVGIIIDGPCDCRLSNIEIMGTRIGLELRNGHTYGDNLHLWTGCMAGRDNGTWWKGTRGIVLGPGANFSASQVYPDSSYYAIEQLGEGGCCELANIMYWEDGSVRNAPDKTGEFYHRARGSTAKLVVNGGLIGVSGPCLAKLYAPEADVRGVVVLNDAPLAARNLDLLCFGRALPDYSERYSERGWCKAADIVCAAPTGACEGILTLDDGAAWRVTTVRTKDRPVTTTLTPLNTLCDGHAVKTCHEDGVERVFARNDAPSMTVRYAASYMGDRFRPLDHGLLRNHRRVSRCHEVRETLGVRSAGGACGGRS